MFDLMSIQDAIAAASFVLAFGVGVIAGQLT